MIIKVIENKILFYTRRRQRDENQEITVNLTKYIGAPVKLPKNYFGQGSHGPNVPMSNSI